MSFKIETTIYIYTGKNVCVSGCIGSYYGLFWKWNMSFNFTWRVWVFFCFSLISLLLTCMCKMNINRMDLKLNSWWALECLRNWWRCGFSFTSEFIWVAFTACWMKWIPSANRWRQSRCGQILPVSRMDTTSDAKKNRVTHTFW